MAIIKRQKINILFICFLVTTLLMISKKANTFKKVGERLNIRNLFDQKKIDYICDKAGNSLKKKYSNGFDEKILEAKKPNKAQNALIDFVRDSEYKYIKKYYSRVVIFFIFLVLDIIFIFCWISYCGCCCCSCCFFKTANPESKILRLIFFLISAICNILVIIFSIIAMSLINSFVRKINGFACSGFNFIDHIKDGLGKSYPKVSNPWVGVLGIKDILNETQNNYEQIQDNTELEQYIKYAKLNYSSLDPDTCGIKNIVKQEDFENETNELSDLINSSFSSIDFDEQMNNIEHAYNRFSDMEDDISGDIYDALHDHINKYVKKYFILFFVFTLIFGFLGLTFLVIYYLFKLNIFRILYVIVWNISMFLMLLSILIGVTFGVFGTVLHDFIRIIQYIVSKDNLYNEDPIIIKPDDHYVSNLIDTCINGNGEFLFVLQENEEIKKNIDNFNQKSIKYNDTIKALSSLNCNDEKSKIAQNSLIDVYNSLLNKTSTVQNMNSNLTELNCGFAKNDETIILNEVNSNSKKALGICACSLLVGIFFGISILAGILFVHRYKYHDESEANVPYKANESSTNIKENNTTNNNTNNNIIK